MTDKYYVDILQDKINTVKDAYYFLEELDKNMEHIEYVFNEYNCISELSSSRESISKTKACITDVILQAEEFIKKVKKESEQKKELDQAKKNRRHNSR